MLAIILYSIFGSKITMSGLCQDDRIRVPAARMSYSVLKNNAIHRHPYRAPCRDLVWMEFHSSTKFKAWRFPCFSALSAVRFSLKDRRRSEPFFWLRALPYAPKTSKIPPTIASGLSTLRYFHERSRIGPDLAWAPAFVWQVRAPDVPGVT